MPFDLHDFCEFLPQQSDHAHPRLSVNEKGVLAMNDAFRKKLGEVRKFRAFYRNDGTQVLLFPHQEPNVSFSSAGGVAKNRQLADFLGGLGFCFPVRYDLQWDEEGQAWVGTCQEMTAPSGFSPRRASRRRGRTA